MIRDLYTAFLFAGWFCGLWVACMGINYLLKQNIDVGIGCLILGGTSMSYPAIKFYKHLRQVFITKRHK